MVGPTRKSGSSSFFPLVFLVPLSALSSSASVIPSAVGPYQQAPNAGESMRTIEIEVVDGRDIRLRLSTNVPNALRLSTIAFLRLVAVGQISGGSREERMRTRIDPHCN